jgi:hypothetical protein
LRDVGPNQLRSNRRFGSQSVIVTAVQRILWLMVALPLLALAGSPFDAPLQVRRVRLPPDPQNPNARRRVSCFYYRSIVVKQVDYGEVGAERLALLPVLSGNATPCRAMRETNEYVIPADSWSGYFKGVKSEYAFFDAADGTNGGLGFMVMRVYGRRTLFEDTAQHGIESMDIQEGTLRLRYQRVFAADCSVLSAGTACRERLIQDTGISEASLLICAQGYQAAQQMKVTGHEAATVIVYEVEASLNDEGPVISRRGDALACHPSD